MGDRATALKNLEKANKAKNHGKRGPDKIKRSILQMFLAAAEKMDGTSNSVEEWAMDNPTDFWKLASKLLPKNIEHSITPDILTAILQGLPSDYAQKVRAELDRLLRSRNR